MDDLESMYRQHVGGLLHFATVLVGPDDAVDVVSEVITATLARNSLDAVVDVRAYWYRAVANTAASWHRSRARRGRRETRYASGEQPAADADVGEARAVLAMLSGRQRAVVYLTYWHDLAPLEVAAMLGVSEGTVRKQLARARARLRTVVTYEL